MTAAWGKKGKGKGEDKNKSKKGDRGKGKDCDQELRPARSTVPMLFLSLCEVGSQARRVHNTIGSAESWGSC